MKRFTLIAVLLLVVSVPAWALGPSIAYGVHGNFTISNFPGPSVQGGKQFTNVYGPGLGGGAHLDVNLLAFSFRISGDYIHYSMDADKFRDAFRPIFGNAVSQISLNGGGLGIASVSVNGKMGILPIPIVTPYITGGLGLGWLSRNEISTSINGVAGATIPSETSSSKTMVHLGAGVDFHFGGVALYAEAKYAWILTEGETSTYVPVTIGVTF
jgi:opacity protein-like surface antigen